MSNYDRWLESPYTDRPEPDECPDCEGARLDEDGEPCRGCNGEGYVAPPTREEIAEVRAEREFDALHEEGRI